MIVICNTSRGDLCLGDRRLADLFVAMENSLHQIPATFDGSFRVPFGKNTTRAVDWIDIVRFAVPALMVPKMRDPGSKMAVMCLVTFIQLSLQKKIGASQLEEMER
jgi:hypothetical protein